ncbi:protein phosphatase 1 regulatory subunit 16A-like [Ceratina calcarata]|uniref:Protein phosphatase 1 regulatory subunit 16A-like n=1 Tax=Ceratina calcarata TaxID=156304 RepID=A0AAJ7NEX5_9HYME|nr:protein phosphatase 1 regulatory subunit 16A-like [Ceratina calcarata]
MVTDIYCKIVKYLRMQSVLCKHTGKYSCKDYKQLTMEHSDLVAEMVHVERLTTQERLHLARHRRLQQLKVWRQREKEWMRHQTRHTSNKRHIYFNDSVMLLEAAARNDIDEGDTIRLFLFLHIAAANGYLRVVEFLLDQHVSTDVEDNDKWQPVHAAACWGHLEVLELLVQNGADLNARNKHDETPADICEDPEIRERIVELKTEQESKRLREAQGRRVRRSQSINTRTQSVRRTSIRDKVLTTKKDAQEEARLRLQAQQTYAPTATNAPQSENGANARESANSETGSTGPPVAMRKSPEGKDDSSFHKDADKDSVTGSESPIGNQQPIYSTDGGDANGKINIHVSVVFVKSLSDLKKQRAQNRHISTGSIDANGNGIPVSPISNSSLNAAGDFQRFTGNTSDIVGDNHSEKSCCTVM